MDSETRKMEPAQTSRYYRLILVHLEMAYISLLFRSDISL